MSSDMPVSPNDERPEDTSGTTSIVASGSTVFRMSEVGSRCLAGSSVLVLMGSVMLISVPYMGAWGWIIGVALLVAAAYIFYLPLKWLKKATMQNSAKRAVYNQGALLADQNASIEDSTSQIVLSASVKRRLKRNEAMQVFGWGLIAIGFVAIFVFLLNTASLLDLQTVLLIAGAALVTAITGMYLVSRYEKQAEAIKLSTD